jgi:hypothetical protein
VKAAVLGDNGDLEDETYDPFRRTGGRSGLGGAAGRVVRGGPRAAVGVAITGLGGARPVTPVYGGGGGGRLPVERETEVVR